MLDVHKEQIRKLCPQSMIGNQKEYGRSNGDAGNASYGHDNADVLTLSSIDPKDKWITNPN